MGSLDTAKVSGRYQIVIPKRIRERLGLQPGDYLLLSVEEDKVVMRLRPRSYTEHLRGLHKEVWQDVEAEDYVRGERATWER